MISGDALISTSFEQTQRYRIPARMTRPPESLNEQRFRFAGRSRILVEIEDAVLAKDMQVGTRWRAMGRFQQRDGPHTGLFRSSYRFKPDIEASRQLAVPIQSRWLRVIFAGRRELSDRISEAFPDDPEINAVLQALLLGDLSDLTDPVMTRFARTGLVHIFAISGLHIGMLAGLLWTVFRWSQVPYRLRAWVVLPVLLMFVLFSGMGASSLRALIMLGCLWAAPFWYRRLDISQAFALAVCVLILLSPGQVADVGFQYSFLLVAGLLIFAPKMTGWLSSHLEADPWAPPDPGRSLRYRILWQPLVQSVSASALCVMIATPITAFYFHLFSPVGILGNLLAVPLVFLVLLTGFPMLVLDLVSVPGVEWLWEIPGELASGLLRWTFWLDSLEYGWFWVRAPETWMTVGVYLCLFAAWRFPVWARPVSAICLALVLMGIVHDIVRWEDATVFPLPTERGQAFLVRNGFHAPVLVDAGSTWDAWQLEQILKQRGINRLDAVFLTHPDRYHISGWRRLGQTWRARSIFAPTPDKEAIGAELDIPMISGVHAGDTISAGGWTIEVLNPPSESTYGRSDDRSLILRFTDGFRSILFMGGVGQRIERMLVEQNAAVSARVLCAGNPRKGAFLYPPFVESVQPEVVLFSGRGFDGITPNRREAEQRIGAAYPILLRAEDM
jgi:competence protein ComEC